MSIIDELDEELESTVEDLEKEVFGDEEYEEDEEAIESKLDGVYSEEDEDEESEAIAEDEEDEESEAIAEDEEETVQEITEDEEDVIPFSDIEEDDEEEIQLENNKFDFSDIAIKIPVSCAGSTKKMSPAEVMFAYKKEVALLLKSGNPDDLNEFIEQKSTPRPTVKDVESLLQLVVLDINDKEIVIGIKPKE